MGKPNLKTFKLSNPNRDIGCVRGNSVGGHRPSYTVVEVGDGPSNRRRGCRTSEGIPVEL